MARIEQTKKSIEQLSIDCDVNCYKVRQEFDEFLEKTRRKAAELCNQMRENTTEEERKWRQILEEKERFPLSDDDDDEEVVSDVQMLGAEFSGRLHESFTPVEEGHFVVTFPEWCQRSLNQLQKEIVDFKTRHRMELELESEFRLQDSNLRWIESIAASNEDVHVFVVDWADKSIKEFAETGEIVGQCPLRDEGFLPWDICCLSQDNFVVCGWGEGRARGGITFLARRKNPPFLEKEKRIKTKKSRFFSSLCQTNEKIFVCDWDFKEILCYSKEGNEIKRIQLEKSLGSGFLRPLLRADLSTWNLWGGARRGMSEFFVWNQNGQILQIVKTGKEILDFCADEFGFFFIFATRKEFFLSYQKKFCTNFRKNLKIIRRFLFLEKNCLFFLKTTEKI